MARDPLGIVLRQVRHLLVARQCGDGTDADLLQRFAAHREEAAFAELMHRHGPMVLSVCRRVSSNLEDADDAFQATFLVLVRKAASIRKGESVGSWLHGVAYRVAREARIRADQRRTHQRQAMNPTPPDPLAQVAGQELRTILDEELDQLPAKYRSPLVLHYLEGKTKEETARQLGWSEGTVSGRLARARDLLRKRLSRRGLTLSGGMLATALSQAGTAPTVPVILTESTQKMALLFAAGQLAAGASAARIAALTESVVKTMFLRKLKVTTAVLLLATAGALGAAGLLYGKLAGQPPAKQQPQSASAQPLANPAALGKSPTQVKKGTIVRVPDSYTLAVALTPDGKILARGGHDARVDLWDVASGKKLHTLTGHTVPILRLSFSPDGKTLASITGTWLPDDVRGEVKLWDVATGKERVSVQGHPNRMLSLAFSRDGKTLATSSRSVKLWDVATGKEKLELEFGKDTLPWSLAFSPDGKTLATGTGGGIMEFTPGEVILWDLTTGKERATLARHAGVVTWVGFSPDGKTLASASGPGSKDEHGNPIQLEKPLASQIKLWDMVTAKERAALPLRLTSPLQFFDLTFAANGKTLVSATSSFGKNEKESGIAVQQWQVATGRLQKTSWATFDTSGPPGAGTNAGVFFAALSADGKTVAWGGAEGRGSPFAPRPDVPITGTANVWSVQALAASPAKKPVEGRPPPGQPDQ